MVFMTSNMDLKYSKGIQTNPNQANNYSNQLQSSHIWELANKNPDTGIHITSNSSQYWIIGWLKKTKLISNDYLFSNF